MVCVAGWTGDGFRDAVSAEVSRERGGPSMTIASSITLLVATMSGTAEMVADELMDALQDAGYPSLIRRMEKVDAATLSEGGLFLICSSTYGTGDVPDNGQPLYRGLCASRPDLSAMRYGLVGLGDSTYSATFCGGPKRWDAIFSELGATRLGTMLCHDRRSAIYPEDAALAWLKDWLPHLADAGYGREAGG